MAARHPPTVVPDEPFTINYGRLKGLLTAVIADAGHKSRTERVCEISGSSALPLIVALVTVDQFKAVGLATGEHIHGSIFTLCVIAVFAFLFSFIRLMMNRQRVLTEDDYIATIRPDDDNRTPTSLSKTRESKQLHKQGGENPDLDGLLKYLISKDGASSREDAMDHLSNTLGSNNPAEAVDLATDNGFLTTSDNIISVTRHGRDYLTHVGEAEAE
ncbi:MAG: hypothetical protein NTW96_06720 [Planctomycetia bacterium]|nr:hypothetical protein [Planctomycetia bacterium]